MIIEKNGDFEFTLSAQSAEFIHESDSRVVATIIINNETVPVSVYRPSQQFHVDIHPPFRIKGDFTWKAYEDLCLRPETAFNLWIDPLDGEVKYCNQLTEASPEELDRVILQGIEHLKQEWDNLKRFHELSEEEERNERSAADREAPRGLLDLLRRSMIDEDD